jgi:hypothetical protein
MAAAVRMSPGNGADLGRVWSDRVVAMPVMTGRQQQAILQVFDPRLEFDAAASDSMIERLADIRDRHWPLLGKNTVLRR